MTTQSLEKIERGEGEAGVGCSWWLTRLAAVYTIAVRTSEFDLPPEMLDDIVAQVVSRTADSSGFGEDQQRRRRAGDFEYDDREQ